MTDSITHRLLSLVACLARSEGLGHGLGHGAQADRTRAGREAFLGGGRIGALTLGPVAYSLGLLQLAQQRGDDAVATFESALDRSRAMRARPYVARSQAGLAQALGLRGAPGDRDRAADLAAQAAATARELEMVRPERELASVAVG